MHFHTARYSPHPAKAWDALVVLYHKKEHFGFLMESAVRQVSKQGVLWSIVTQLC